MKRINARDEGVMPKIKDLFQRPYFYKRVGVFRNIDGQQNYENAKQNRRSVRGGWLVLPS